MTTSTHSNSNDSDQPFLPGRLSDPNNVLKTDPRAAELLCDKGYINQAKDYLDLARDLFTKMNMPWWIEQTKNLREKL